MRVEQTKKIDVNVIEPKLTNESHLLSAGVGRRQYSLSCSEAAGASKLAAHVWRKGRESVCMRLLRLRPLLMEIVLTVCHLGAQVDPLPWLGHTVPLGCQMGTGDMPDSFVVPHRRKRQRRRSPRASAFARRGRVHPQVEEAGRRWIRPSSRLIHTGVSCGAPDMHGAGTFKEGKPPRRPRTYILYITFCTRCLCAHESCRVCESV